MKKVIIAILLHFPIWAFTQELPTDITVENERGINSVNSDFAPAFWHDYIVFTTSNKNEGEIDPNNSEKFYNLYLAGINKFDKLENSALLSKKLSSHLHESNATFARNDNSIFFSALDQEGYLNIYTSEYKNNEWGLNSKLSINEAESNTTHPSVNALGDTLFFSSDRAGGYGKYDLYISVFKDGEWTEPQNLGPEINSNGNDVFPSLIHGAYLVFSKKERNDFDLFYTKLNFENLIVKKLPNPINSNFDDLCLITNSFFSKGYFTSNRPGGIGKDDIYSFTSNYNIFEDKIEELYIIKLIDKNDDPLQDCMVKYRSLNEEELLSFDQNLFDISAEPYDSLLTREDGSIQFGLEHNYYLIEASCPEKESYNVIVNKKSEKLIKTITLQDLERKQTIENIKTLNNQELNIGTVLVFENIYYDYNSHEIKKGAANELDDLLKVMKENPKLQIELISHTDSRGENDYNLELSKKRALSAKLYLTNKGINESRITTKGLGETLLRNHCKDGVQCSEAEHVYNRRTEVKILRN